MKYLQKIIGILFSIFLLLPLSTHASSFSFTSNSSLFTTTCTESKCTFVITWKGTTKAQLPFSLWKTKDSSGALKDKVFETQTIFDPAQKKTSSTFSIENLLPDTYYYINYDGFFTIKTEPITVVKSGANQLKLTPNNTSLVASIVTSPTETRPLSINFESPLSPGISVLRKSVPLDVATKSRKDIALFDMGEIPLPIGSYGAYLEAGQVPVYTKLVGPFPYEVHDTSLTYQWPLTVKDKSDTSITLSGKITAAKNVDPTTYTITFEVADTATVFDPNSKGSGDTEVRQAQVSKIGTDGSYSVTINNLTASQVYYFRHTIQSPFSPSQSKVGKFSGTDGLLAYGDDGDPQKDFNNRSYRLLSPLPGLSAVLDPDLCAEYAKEGKDLSKGTICDINQFINYIMKLLIGLAGVMLVLRIMFEGYQYLVTDVPALKSGAKNSIVESALGLVLALSAYLILNTINPQLVSNGVQLNDVAAGIESFTISGGATFDGKPIKVDFKTQAYPYAKTASDKTGVDTALILAMFEQESSGGTNTGKCNPTIPNSNMKTDDYEYLKDPLIVVFNKSIKERFSTLPPLTITSVNISCNSQGSNNGGAIGYTQFMPTTWKDYRLEGTNLLGYEPFPWDTKDALMMTALFLKRNGGGTDDESKQMAAVCAYFGKCDQQHLVYCPKPTLLTYDECVMGKKTSIQQQIDAQQKK